MKKVLVTGGAGFIGSNLVEALLQKDISVRVIDDLSTGKQENIAGFLNKIDFVKASITNMDSVKKAVKDVDCVFHLAAMASVPRSIKMPIESAEVNITGSLNLLVASMDAGVDRIVYSSSASVYGDSPILPKSEEMPANPKSPYGLTKYAAEKYMQIFYSLYGLKTFSLRYFNVFGPKQDPLSSYAAVVPRFITGILNQRRITIDGDGEQSRDFTYVKDAVQANILASESKKGAGEVFNVAGGKTVTVNQLREVICEMTGKQVDFVHGPSRDGDIKHSLADISKAKKLLGYEPIFDFKEAIEETIRWYRHGLQSPGK